MMMEAKSTTRLPPRLFSLLGNPIRETQTSPEEATTKDLTPFTRIQWLKSQESSDI